MKLEQYLSDYPPAAPQRSAQNTDEIRKLLEADGVRQLGRPPVVTSEKREPDKSGDPGCHLWVFESYRIPYILERAIVATSLASGVVKHTNLTGGGPAACGGELWAAPSDDRLLYINGCSGRYGPKTAQQLRGAEEVFEQLGYRVRSFGWDEDAGKPARVLR